MPAPQVLLVHRQRAECSAVQASSHGDCTCGRALRVSPVTICCALRPGLIASISAAVPATIGVAKLVPALRA
jgi:hypothetical protein